MTSPRRMFSVILPVLLLTLALSPAKAQIRCEDAFSVEIAVTVSRPDPSILKSEPGIVRIVLDAEQIQGFFDRGREKFEKSLGDGSRLSEVLTKLSRGGKADSATEAELKALRKLAIILRSDFIVLDENHEVPDSFERFTKAFGKLNDAIEFKAQKLIPDLAARVLELAEPRKLARDLDRFGAASPKSVEKTIIRLRTDIVELASGGTLSVHDFHEVRKLLKHVLTFVQTAQSFDPTPEKTFAFQYMSALNDALGGLRQDALESQVRSLERGKLADDEIETQKLPGKLRRQILAVLNRLAIARPAKTSREAMAIETHLRFDRERGVWQVLWPRKKDGFEVLEFDSHGEALAKARKIEEPLDLEAVRSQAELLLPRVRASLVQILGPDFGGRIDSRVKEAESLKAKIFEKALAKGPKAPWTRITDILGLRITVADETIEARVAQKIHDGLGKILVEEHERDFDRGYHAHHLVGQLDEGPRFEIQVLTDRMARWSDWEHDRLYKPVEPLSDEARALLTSYAQALAQALRRADQGREVTLPSAEAYRVPARDRFPSPVPFHELR